MDELYGYDNQLDSINDWLCKISESLDEIKESLKSNKNKIELAPYIGEEQKGYPVKLCDDCKKELDTIKEGAGRCYTICKNCNVHDAANYLSYKERNTVKYDSGTGVADE